ncbi:MAG: OmpA family protein [Saprospiraceae bacterium]
MRYLLVIILSMSAFGISAQDEVIKLTNPSFEDTPRRGGSRLHGIKGWYDCGIINFPQETPPDIHPKDFWNNTKQASDGATYLGMVVRDNDSWESVSQRLETPMQAGECYSFSLELSQSKRYISLSRLNSLSRDEVNYSTPTVIRIWGGSGYCNTKELIGESAPVTHSGWKNYAFKFSPTFNHRYITFEAFYKVPVLFPYNGHILVDNCSDLVKIQCNEEIVATVDESVKKIPPHKRSKKKPKKKPKTAESTTPTDIAVETTSSPAKSILNLDRKNLIKDQIIEIKSLYFEADTSSISNESFKVLEEVYRFLNENKDINVEVRGHTNDIPPDDYCDRLSTERAKVVAQHLVKLGIDGERLTYRGLGKRKPVASNKTRFGRKKNQRVEIKIISIG